MDAAAQTLLKKTAFILTIASLLVSPALADTTIAVSTTSVALASQPVPISVTSVPVATPMHFTVTNVASGGWYSATLSDGSTSGTTPATLILQIVNSNCQFTNSCTGTVTLTPDTGDAVSINVTLGTGGGGGGTNSITVNPNPVSLSAAQGGIATTTATVQTSSASPISLSIGGSFASWLTPTLPAGSSVSTLVTASISLTANSAGLANNTSYQTSFNVIPATGGSVTVTVNFCVGTCSGNPGNPTSGSMTSSLSTFSFGYPSGSQAQTVTIDSTTNPKTTSYNATVTAGNWLLLSGNSGLAQTQLFSQPLSQSLTIYLNTSVAATLGTGVFSGTVVVSPADSSNAANATITVSLTVNGGSVSGITLSANTVTFNQTVGATALQSSAITVSTTSGTAVNYSVSATTSTGGSWLIAGQSNATLPGTITASTNGAVTGTLAQGTYQGSIQISYTGGISATQNIPVTLVVGNGGTNPGGGGTGNLISPTSLTFACQATVNCNSVNVASQVLAVGGSGLFTATPTVSTTQQWLTVTQSGVAPGVAYVGINPGNLGAGTYQGTVALNVSNGGSQSVTVTLNIVAGTVAEAFPGSFAVSYQAGGSAIANQGLTVAMSDNSAQSISLSSNQSWVSVVSQGSSLTTASYAITFNPAGLANGVYLATLTATVGNAVNSPLGIPVVLTVTGSTSGGTANLTFSQSSLNFSAQTNGAAPATMSLTATSAVNTTGTVGVTTTSGGTWLSIAPSGTVGLNPSLSFTVSVSQAGLAAGTYSGSINFNANGGTSTVPVTLVVSATGGGGGQSGNVTVNPSTPLAFSYQVGGGAPGSQNLSITNSQGLLVGLTVTPTTQAGSGNWLTTNFVAGMTSNTTPLTVSVDPTQLTSTAAGSYTGNIAIQPTGGTLVNVSVTLTVTNVTVTASLSGGGTSITFSYRAGDTNPATQTINVSGNGGALTFSATVSSTGNWLSVSPTTGTTPVTGTIPVTVSVNPAALTAGTFTGTIIVAGTGSATGSTTFNVSITVTAPPPTITGVVNAATFLAGRVSPGEIITITGTALGPTTGVGTAIDPATGKVATTLAGVTVLVSGFPAPLTYVSATQVNAVVPYEVKNLISPFVQVKYTGGTSNAFSLTAAASSPGIFTVNFGTGPAAALNSNNQVNSPSNPAAKGDTVVLYLTGEGDTNPAGVTGKVTTVASTLPLTPAPLLAVGVTVDGQPVFVQFVGEAPGFVSGVLQLNIQIPANARTGDLPLFVNIGGASSQNSVTVSVK